MPAVLLVSKEEQRVRARESDIQEVTGKKMTEKDTKIKINRMGGKKWLRAGIPLRLQLQSQMVWLCSWPDQNK